MQDKPNVKREPSMQYRSFDFTPSYVHPTTSRQGGVSKRASKTKEPPKPVRVIQIPSFSQDVQLHKADNAWTPVAIAKKKGADVKADEIDDLPKKVLYVRFEEEFDGPGILYKALKKSIHKT